LKYLIFGSSGKLGSVIAEHLAKKGDVLGVQRSSSDSNPSCSIDFSSDDASAKISELCEEFDPDVIIFSQRVRGPIDSFDWCSALHHESIPILSVGRWLAETQIARRRNLILISSVAATNFIEEASPVYSAVKAGIQRFYLEMTKRLPKSRRVFLWANILSLGEFELTNLSKVRNCPNFQEKKSAIVAEFGRIINEVEILKCIDVLAQADDFGLRYQNIVLDDGASGEIEWSKG